MKLFLRIVVMVAILSTNAWARMAEMMPVKAGTVEKYTSDNGKYEVSIMYGSNNFMSWSLAENGVQLWSRPLMCEPSPAAVSDNGETITLPIWGWRDECASKGVAVYNKKGELVKEVLFRSEPPEEGSLLPAEEALLWVRQTKISPDGKYFAIGYNGSQAAGVTLYNAATGDAVWDKKIGLPEMVQIKVAREGKYVLVATHEDKEGWMEFLLLDSAGAVLWSKKIGNNFSWEVKHYIKFKDDGSGFEIYDLKSEKYISEAMPKAAKR